MRLLTPAKTYTSVYENFRWNVPDRVNMGVQVCDRHLAGGADRPALIVAAPNTASKTYSFGDISRLSNQLANVFTAKGLRCGDRVGILLSQSVEAAIAHIAAWKMGAISIPLFKLFGEDALSFRLADSGARLVVTDHEQLAKVAPLQGALPSLETLLVVDLDGTDGGGLIDFWRAMEAASDTFDVADTGREDPSFICYTSGTTGNPKGALHAHRSLIGHMPAVEFFHGFLPQPGDLMWTPAEAWAIPATPMSCLARPRA